MWFDFSAYWFGSLPSERNCNPYAMLWSRVKVGAHRIGLWTSFLSGKRSTTELRTLTTTRAILSYYLTLSVN